MVTGTTPSILVRLTRDQIISDRALSFALTLASGIALTQAVWGWQAAWIGVGLAALGVLIVIGATTSRRAMGRLQASGDASAVAAALTFSFIVRASLLIGIVFLMTVNHRSRSRCWRLPPPGA